MQLKHRSDASPATYRGHGIQTEPGDIIDVSEATAEQLLAKPYFVAVGGSPDGDGDAGDDELPQSYESLTYDELYDRATEADIAGRSEMDKAELIDALREG